VAIKTAPKPDAPAATRAAPTRAVRVAGVLTGVTLVLAALFAWNAFDRRHENALTDAEPNVPAAWQRPAVTERGLEQTSGIRIVQVALTGDGGLIDLRFQVVDPNLAASIHDPANPPAIVDASTGVVANSLLMGHSHTSPFDVGVTYYLIFEDPGNLIQRGDEVSVLLGDAQVDHVQVR